MNKFKFTYAAIFMMIMLSCGTSKKEAEELNNSLSFLINNVDAAGNDFLTQTKASNNQELRESYLDFKSAVTAANTKCTMLKPVEGDEKLMNAAVLHFKSIENLCNGEIKQLLASKESMVNDSIPDQNEVTANEQRLQKIIQSMNETKNSLLEEQKAFCEKWGIPVKQLR